MSTQIDSDPIIRNAEEVRNAVEHVLSSHAFRNSKRHTRFLRFVVEKALAGDTHQIKERVIGIEVFDRDAAYDVTSDPIVRVGAGDIRKRLAQYYSEEGRNASLRISLPAGAYVPIFSSVEPHYRDTAPISMPGVEPIRASLSSPPDKEQEGETDPSDSLTRPLPLNASKAAGRKRHLLALAAVSLGLALAVLVVLKGVTRSDASGSDRFWQPAMKSESDAILCVGDLNFLMVKGEDTSQAANAELEGVMVAKNHVGPADVAALARMAATFGHYEKRFRVLLADDATLSDLRTAPAVLIGAMDNQWTSRLLSSSRFQFSEDPVTRIGRITDSKNPNQHQWVIDMRMPISAIRRDYGLVTRNTNPLTGQTDFMIGGIGPYGTAAASEFATNPKYFAQFAAHAPSEWDKHDIQIVVSTDVVNGRTAPPQLVSFDLH